MLKKIVPLLLVSVLSLGFFSAVLANHISAQEASPEPNSYELFWPLVAGKTIGDSWYSVKIFGEKVRGAIIFGAAAKANYEVLLATKRTLEAEKLVQEGKFAGVNTTLRAAVSELQSASKHIDAAKLAGISLNAQEMSDRLTNLVPFAKWLSGKYGESHDLFLQVSEMASAQLAKL